MPKPRPHEIMVPSTSTGSVSLRAYEGGLIDVYLNDDASDPIAVNARDLLDALDFVLGRSVTTR